MWRCSVSARSSALVYTANISWWIFIFQVKARVYDASSVLHGDRVFFLWQRIYKEDLVIYVIFSDAAWQDKLLSSYLLLCLEFAITFWLLSYVCVCYYRFGINGNNVDEDEKEDDRRIHIRLVVPIQLSLVKDLQQKQRWCAPVSWIFRGKILPKPNKKTCSLGVWRCHTV